MSKYCDKCQRTFKGPVGLGSHHCVSTTPDFSEWRHHNPKLSPLWDELEGNHLEDGPNYERPTPPSPPAIEDMIQEIGCCLNWQQGIPLPIAIKRREEKEKKAKNIKIFKEMMDEDIRPHHFNK